MVVYCGCQDFLSMLCATPRRCHVGYKIQDSSIDICGESDQSFGQGTSIGNFTINPLGLAWLFADAHGWGQTCNAAGPASLKTRKRLWIESRIGSGRLVQCNRRVCILQKWFLGSLNWSAGESTPNLVADTAAYEWRRLGTVTQLVG